MNKVIGEKNESQFIIQSVNLYVEEVTHGIYRVIKNRGGERDIFLTQSELVKKMNRPYSLAIETSKNIIVYTHLEYDFLIHLNGYRKLRRDTK